MKELYSYAATRPGNGRSRKRARRPVPCWGLALPWIPGGAEAPAGVLLLAMAGLAAWVVYQQIDLRRRAVRRLRKRVARDLHDELGGKLTVINLYGELAAQTLERDPETARRHLQKVLRTSRELHVSMKELLWLFNPEYDNVADLWQRLQETGNRLFRDSGIRFQAQGPSAAATAPLRPEQKRHILLIFKEAMHNTLKYAEGTEGRLQWELEAQRLHITWRDNGKGFRVAERMGTGEGLQNMRRRAEAIGATLRLHSSPAGTCVSLQCPLWPARPAPLVDRRPPIVE